MAGEIIKCVSVEFLSHVNFTNGERQSVTRGTTKRGREGLSNGAGRAVESRSEPDALRIECIEIWNVLEILGIGLHLPFVRIVGDDAPIFCNPHNLKLCRE